MITTVKKWNDSQEKAFLEFAEKCRKNSSMTEEEIQAKRNQYFTFFPYKTGFVLWGRYPIWKRRKMDF